MARGDQAKAEVVRKLQEAFGADYIGEANKKYYVWAKDNGQKCQISISLTCPKVELEVGAAAPATSNGGWDFESAAIAQPIGQTSFEPAEITEEEENNIAELLRRIGM